MDVNYYLKYAKKPQEGTFKWIKDLPCFKGFDHGQSSRLIHITGKPGCGKTVLAAWLFKDVKKAKLFNVEAFYACNGRDASRRTAEAILSSLVLQLSKYKELRKSLKDLLPDEEALQFRFDVIARVY